jgi:hypothetical protein
MMAPPLPTDLPQRRIRLTRAPTAAGEARRQVRATIRAWQVPVDPDIALLLTSDLVTSAVNHGDGTTVTLVIRCSCGHLRVDTYYDTRPCLPEADAPAGPGTGPGLMLVAALSTGWGSFQTPAGQVAYFTLAFTSDGPGEAIPAPRPGRLPRPLRSRKRHPAS